MTLASRARARRRAGQRPLLLLRPHSTRRLSSVGFVGRKVPCRGFAVGSVRAPSSRGCENS